ncbi:transmembrane protein 134 isoform X7 [Manis pentadactyla]|uniref:transmembrane protein 134 isoform X7 n=1 Tax=Manis pentadactyla TaxID=143292 RepID=UPI00255C5F26|nr:transmembrane protein 134 isoform X7 [Manis pentadactyla]
MTPSSCPWRTQALGPSPVGSPASGRCTSSAGPDSRWPTRTSSPGCATRTWRMMRMEPRPLQSRTGESAPGQDKLDSTPFDPEELPGSAGLLPAPAAGAGHISARQVPCSENTELVLILTGVGLEVAPSPGERPASAGHRRPWQARPPPSRKGTPQSRSLPRDLHLLRGQGPPRLPVLLPALLREVSRGELRDPASAPSSCAAPWHPQRALLGPAAHSVPSSLGKSLSRTLDPPLPLGSLLRKFGAPRPQPAYLGLGKSPRTGSVP